MIYVFYHATFFVSIAYTNAVVTSSIVRSTSHRYLIYSDANFEVFLPAGPTRCTVGVKFGTEEGTEGPVPFSMPNFTPISATTRV